MEETYQLIEGSPSLRDLDVENGFLWCPFGHSGRQNEPGILISRLDDGSYDVRLGTGFDSPERFAAGDPDWSWMDIAVDSTVDVTFADDIALNDWIASETTATGAAWARCFNPGCGPDGETCDAKEITAALKRFESPSYIARGAIEDIESLPVGYYWCPDALDPDPSYNGYLLNVFVGFTFGGAPGKFFELFGGVTLNDVPSFGFDDGWDGSCLNRLDWFEDAVGMDADGLSAGLVANDAESVKALVGNCPAWIECFPSYSEKAAKGVDDVAQAVQAYRVNAKRVHSEVIPGYLYELVKTAAARNGADTGYSQLDSDFVNASNSWDEVYGFIKRSDPNAPGMPASFDYALLALDSNGWHFGESSASAFDIPVKDLDFFLGIFYCSSISEFATYASECNEPDFQEWLCSMYLRDQVEDRLRHEISCNCMQSTVDAFKLLSDKIGFEFEPENNPANVAKAASAAAGRSVDSGLSEAGGIKH